jgi:gluconate 5-dehydrogenase
VTDSLAQRFRLDGKVALVTGGYGGIGDAVSHGLAQAGAKVAVSGHNAEKAAACAEALRAAGCDSYAVAFDSLSSAETRRMVDDVAGHFGRLDVLVNCVGLNREEKAEEVTEEMFDHVMDVNLKSAMFQAQAAARHMIRQGAGGKQVHIGSVRTLLALRGRGYAAYCASKGGLAILCKQLAAEWAPHRINVNVVAPTFVRTEQVAHMLSDQRFYDSSGRAHSPRADRRTRRRVERGAVFSYRRRQISSPGKRCTSMEESRPHNEPGRMFATETRRPGEDIQRKDRKDSQSPSRATGPRSGPSNRDEPGNTNHLTTLRFAFPALVTFARGRLRRPPGRTLAGISSVSLVSLWLKPVDVVLPGLTALAFDPEEFVCASARRRDNGRGESRP